MADRTDGGAAFPQLEVVVGERDGHGDAIEAFTSSVGGMSLRDWFAGQALAGMMVNGFMPHQAREIADKDPNNPFGSQWDYGVAAYVMADAMLAARKEGGA